MMASGSEYRNGGGRRSGSDQGVAAVSTVGLNPVSGYDLVIV